MKRRKMSKKTEFVREIAKARKQVDPFVGVALDAIIGLALNCFFTGRVSQLENKIERAKRQKKKRWR